LKSLANNLLPYDGEAYLYKGLFQEQNLLEQIKQEVKWRNDKIKMFGKTYQQARKVAWEGDEGIKYCYSNILMQAVGWSPSVMSLKQEIETFLERPDYFNSALVNLYRTGTDHMSWHSDNEKELGVKPLIASLSFGATRDFFFRHQKGHKVKIELSCGDLLIMQGQTQEFWKHSLPKRLKVHTERLNITFRKIQQF
jgi:alkylated DNA repair dioxygenase AlkB